MKRAAALAILDDDRMLPAVEPHHAEPNDDAARACRNRRRKDRPHRVHRAGEPQLRQSLLRLSRRRHRNQRQKLQGQNDRPQAGQPQRVYDIEHSAQAMFAACDGTGSLPGKKCRMDGFDRRGRLRRRRPIPQYVYVPHAETKPVLRHGARMGAGRPHVPVAARRELRRAPIHHRGAGAVERRSSVRRSGAASGGRAIPSTRSPSDRNPRGPQQPPASTTRRWATSSTPPVSRGAFTPAASARPAAASGSGGRPIKPSIIFTTAPIGRNVIAPQKRFLTDVAQGKLATSPGSRRLCEELRSPRLRRRLRTVVGCLGRQRDRREQVLELDGDLRAVGRLGRTLRSRAAAVSGLRRLGIPRSAARDFAVRQERLRLARAVRNGQRPALRRGSLGPAPARGGRRARDVSPAADCFDFTQTAAQVRPHSRPRRAGILHQPAN